MSDGMGQYMLGKQAEQKAKHAQITAAILAKVAQGLTVREAIDAVLGAGTVQRVAGEVYDALRAKAAS